MGKNKTFMNRALGGALAFLMLFSLGDVIGTIRADAVVESVGGSDSLVRTSLTEIKSVLTSLSYGEYLETKEDVPSAKEEIDIDLFNWLVKPADYDQWTEKQKDNDVNKDSYTTSSAQKGNGADYGTSGDILLLGDDGKISYVVNIPSDAFYNIQIEYYTGNIVMYRDDGSILAQGKSTTIERMVLIDGNVPFKEARSITLQRKWVDTYTGSENSKFDSTSDAFNQLISSGERPFENDSNGNEMKPDKTLCADWAVQKLVDSSGYDNEPLKFYLSAGSHTLTLSMVREAFGIKSIKLVPVKEPITYDQYLAEHSGAKDYEGDYVYKIQAEYPTATSDRTLYQLNDRTSVLSEPQDSALIRLNSIGGDKWTYAGQWIEYEVTVPEDGFYNIIPRSLQSSVAGSYVSRRITIDGAIPFKEASYLRFNYSDKWQTNSLSDGTNEFKFYLTAGTTHTIRFEVTLGDLASVLSEVETILNKANGYYRKILILTGPDPDEYRDYGFENLIPDVLKGLKQYAKELQDISNRLSEITGSKGENSGALERLALTMERMGQYPSKIAASMSTFKDYLAALGSWLTSMQNQPLTLDYVVIQAVNAEHPTADANFWDKFIGEVKKFWASFFSDYNSVSSTTETVKAEEYMKASIEVWTTSSRDHAQIIRNLVDDDFMKKYNIPVSVKLVAAGTLLPATLAGTGPDISMGIDQSTPINYAIRSAVLSLNSNNHGYDFNDFSRWADNPVFAESIANDSIDTFDETFDRFADAAAVPLTLYGETYAVPENMSFSMMFYRKDIFVEQNIAVPNTWDEFYQIINSLQASALEIGFPTGVAGSTILMYQLGETMYQEGNYEAYLEQYHDMFYKEDGTANPDTTYYNDEGDLVPKTDGMAINLDSDVSLAKFKQVCELFTMYNFPVSYTFADRFRNGSMPIGVVDYTTYNTLIIFAPEIKGLWEFTPLPGTLQADGKTIDNTTLGSVSAMIMMRSVTEDNALSAWAFMQWWTSAGIQSSFANEMEALLGPSAKQNTANIEALEAMAWSKDELDNLKAQFNAVTCTPEYPGSYIIGRYTNFAFLNVYNKEEDPVETMRGYITDINNELTRKRTEFGLPTTDSMKAYADSHAGSEGTN